MFSQGRTDSLSYPLDDDGFSLEELWADRCGSDAVDAVEELV